MLDVSYGSFGPPGHQPLSEGATLHASMNNERPDEVEAGLRAMSDEAADQFFCDWTCRQLEITLHTVATELRLLPPPPLPNLD